VIETAKNVAGSSHHFRFIQTPFNFYNQKALTDQKQQVQGKWLSLFQAAEELDVYVTTSAPLDCGRLKKEQNLNERIRFVQDTPSILSTMIGMRTLETVKRNLSLFKEGPGSKY
jgi:predicted aldo/keto reductase-like oxidoreductase